MKYNIHADIESLALEIDSLIPWEPNPHKGNIPAIMASYQEFGQIKPIVVKINGDGTYLIIAGNHQTEAAKRLGWTHIAATRLDTDDKRAIAFALADNRTTQLGSDDPVLLHEAVVSVMDEYPEMFDSLGWDDFQIAAMEEQVEYLNAADAAPTGYVAPVLVSQPGEEGRKSVLDKSVNLEDEQIFAPASVNTFDAVTRGAGAVGSAGAKSIVQYMLVFDDADQQRRWYDFLRWLRIDVEINGETTAERLLDFLEARVDF